MATETLTAPAPAATERDAFCHLSGNRVLPGEDLWTTVCGRTLHEPLCCDDGAPSCGRQSCPRCDEIVGGTNAC